MSHRFVYRPYLDDEIKAEAYNSMSKVRQAIKLYSKYSDLKEMEIEFTPTNWNNDYMTGLKLGWALYPSFVKTVDGTFEIAKFNYIAYQTGDYPSCFDCVMETKCGKSVGIYRNHYHVGDKFYKNITLQWTSKYSDFVNKNGKAFYLLSRFAVK